MSTRNCPVPTGNTPLQLSTSGPSVVRSQVDPPLHEPLLSTSQGPPSLLEHRVSTLETLLKSFAEQTQQQLAQLLSQQVSSQQAEIPPLVTENLPPSPAAEENQELLAYEGSLMHFDGKMPWEEYLVHVEVTAEANGWTETRTGKKLASAMKGAALTALCELPKATRTNYQQILEAMSTRFGLRTQAAKMKLLLIRRKQAEGEGLAELAADIERLIRGAYPDEPKSFRDTVGVQRFLDAMRHTGLRTALALASPATVQEALMKAQLAETLGSDSDPFRRPEFRCWGCNSTGHSRAACPKSNQTRANVLDHPQNPEN